MVTSGGWPVGCGIPQNSIFEFVLFHVVLNGLDAGSAAHKVRSLCTAITREEQLTLSGIGRPWRELLGDQQSGPSPMA